MRYEMVLEIYNSCSRNKMRDIFFEEREIADTEAFILREEPGCTFERFLLADGTEEYYIQTADMKKKYSFTPLD